MKSGKKRMYHSKTGSYKTGPNYDYEVISKWFPETLKSRFIEPSVPCIVLLASLEAIIPVCPKKTQNKPLEPYQALQSWEKMNAIRVSAIYIFLGVSSIFT